MQLNPIGVAVPFFFLLMGVELWVARRQRRRVYRLNDSISDLGCGMGDQLVAVFSQAFLLGIYVVLWEAFALFDWASDSAWTWLVGMVGVDFFYYWYHRFSHRVNFAWATHVVHHQSEEYNLAVALRQPWFSKIYGWAFYLPLAVLGIPPLVYATSFALNLLYQFWIHTRLIGKLGPAEWVFNTPSHHRVHHGTNPEYIDRNYAGILIIWDRLFGSFVEEEAEPVYGIVKPLRSWNPLWANVQPWIDLARQSVAASAWGDKLRAWLMPPEWQAEDSPEPGAVSSPERGYNLDSMRGLHPYMLWHLIPVGALMAGILLYTSQLGLGWLLAGSLAVAWPVLVWSGMLERRAWALPLEASRLLLIALLSLSAAWLGGLWLWVTAVGLFSSAASGWWLARCYRRASASTPPELGEA